MSFQLQVHVHCLICKKLTETAISENGTNVEALNLLHNKLCLALKLEFSPKFREWDFGEEPFPYCESCIQRLQRLGELIDQLKSIEKEINGALATVSALVISSDKSDATTSDPLLTPKLGQLQEYFRSLQEKHNYFRSLIIQQFDPRVRIERWANCNYPGSSDEYNDYELVPKATFLETESHLEGFLNTTAEEAVLSEIKHEVGTSSTVKCGDDLEALVGLNETWTSLSDVRALMLVSNAADKENSSTAVSHSVDDQDAEMSCQQYDVLGGHAPKTDQFNGYKFKVFGNGFYKCCTCGHVSKTSHPELGQRNIRLHIIRVHLRTPTQTSDCSKVCGECGRTFSNLRALRAHRGVAHRDYKFQCGYCGTKFRVNWSLQQHLLEHKVHGEKPCLGPNPSDKDGTLGANSQVENAPGFDPRVEVERCDDNCNYPGLSDEYYDYELVPKDTSRMIYSDLEGFLDTPAEEAVLSEIKCEVETSCSPVKGGGKLDPFIGLNKNFYTVSDVAPALNLVSSASDKEENSTEIFDSVDEEEDVPKPKDCEDCGEGFQTSQDLYQNCMCSHRAYKLQCDHCGLKFQLNSQLQQHLLKHGEHEKRPCLGLNASDRGGTLGGGCANVCGECDRTFSNLRALSAHHAIVHRRAKFQCDHCGAKFRLNLHLQQHLLNHGEEGDKPCLGLNAPNKEGTLGTDIPVTIDPGIPSQPQQYDLLCDGASKTYELNGFKFKKLEKGYKCCTCSGVLGVHQRGISGIKRHIWSVHMGISKGELSSRVCKECGKMLSNGRALNLHIATAHRAPKFHCDFCGAGFQLNSHLLQHLLQHGENGEKQSLGLNASDSGGTLGTTIPANNVIQIPSQKKDLLCDEASETFEFSGFKFKVTEKGYECCTCGLVSTVLQGGKHNMKRHISTVHMRISGCR